jgi:drug/metabolite transporter (DMT)-like permease
VRITRLNVAGEIAVVIVVVAVLVYELIYSDTAARALAVVALVLGSALCRLTVRWLSGHPDEVGKVQLAIALVVGASFLLADRLPRTGFTLLCALVAGYLATALYGLRSGLRAQGGA